MIARMLLAALLLAAAADAPSAVASNPADAPSAVDSNPADAPSAVDSNPANPLQTAPEEPGSSLALDVCLMQPLVFFSSERVTIGGAGLGLGLQAARNGGLLGQVDCCVLWGNGNVAAARLAVGWQFGEAWKPAVFGTIDVLLGQRTETLSPSGQRPASPVWAVGLRVAPLRFEASGGRVSLLECGYGIGPDGGACYELSVLSATVRL